MPAQKRGQLSVCGGDLRAADRGRGLGRHDFVHRSGGADQHAALQLFFL